MMFFFSVFSPYSLPILSDEFVLFTEDLLCVGQYTETRLVNSHNNYKIDIILKMSEGKLG